MKPPRRTPPSAASGAAVLFVLILWAGQTAGAAAETKGAAMAAPERSLKVFFSGHSLTDRPMPDDLAAIGASLGVRMDWDRQHIAGSTIMERVAGLSAGNAAGVDRDGKPIAIARAFAGGPEKRPFDVLVVTEQHALLSALRWQDTVGQLRLLHDAFIDANPRGATYFYEPWMSIDDKSAPEAWIAYEKAAAPMWRCVVAGVNRSLASRSRPDRIATIPAALALAELVDAAPQGSVPGAATRGEAANLLVADDVHPTPLGAYFVALVTYASLERHAPEGAWAPAGVTAEQASALQRFAANYVGGRQEAEPDLDACGAAVETSFADTFWTYFERARWRKEMGPLAARLRLAQEKLRGRVQSWRGVENPFLVRADVAARADDVR